MKYKGGPSFVTILTIGTIVALFSSIVIFFIIRALIRLFQKTTLIKDHYLHLLTSLPHDLVHHFFQIFLFFKIFIFVPDEAFPATFQSFLLEKPGLGIFYAIILFLDILRIFVVFKWCEKVQRDQGLALVRIDAFVNGTSFLICRIPLMLVQRAIMDKFYFPNFLVLFICYDNLFLLYSVISSAYYAEIKLKNALNFLSKTFIIISLPIIFIILSIFRMALQFSSVDISKCLQIVTYGEFSYLTRKSCTGILEHFFIYLSILPYLLIPALIIKNYYFIRSSMKKNKSLLDNFILDKVHSRNPSEEEEHKETLEEVDEFSQVLKEVKVDDEVFDNRISSSSGPYHMVGYVQTENEPMSQEAQEVFQDQSLKTGASSLKYLEFQSMSREEKNMWLKNGIDPETGETAANSEDEEDVEFYSSFASLSLKK
ncbi:Oidioi.mRNA.OKI2018_I69.chr1.g791.t1.cds [Oikopleura dioica]|uniref:Oidioi.mRNA.OKI2018_I69.chr1.g791.t1.cds n=1 Tax=Oikopleura dioica TaxID=34765 RepID=A0ABN7SLH0_OIKDI|nr:Oidioi.mRNA.OKI2018_I69.chr1.g791.t1.cds [Oikopleura dioica]